MSSLRFLRADALPGFLSSLAKVEGQPGVERRVLAPVRQGKAVVFAPYAGGDVILDKASLSPKEAVLPRCETLLSWHRGKDPEDQSKATLRLDDTPEACPTVIFGCRPCDARGFAVLDNPFLHGPHQDPYYRARREQLVVITLACAAPCPTGFCHWVGGGPDSTDGSDILLTKVRNADGMEGYALQAVTAKGRELLSLSRLPMGEGLEDKVREAHAQALAALPQAPALNAAQARIAQRFTDADFWQRQTAACLGCGACTYMCPTCYCFNMTDEGDGQDQTPGRRLRTWDTCMASHFTREASGHNPRVLKAQRMRNRVSHKFSTYPSLWEGRFSCSGCGRCIAQCPVHLDIRAIVLAAMADEE